MKLRKSETRFEFETVSNIKKYWYLLGIGFFIPNMFGHLMLEESPTLTAILIIMGAIGAAVAFVSYFHGTEMAEKEFLGTLKELHMLDDFESNLEERDALENTEWNIPLGPAAGCCHRCCDNRAGTVDCCHPDDVQHDVERNP